MSQSISQSRTQAPTEAENIDHSLDTVFQTLGNQRRRFTISYLKTVEETATIREVATQVAAWENDISVEELSYQDRKRVYTSLYQSHLPKLAAAGFINYDRDRGIIKLTKEVDNLDLYLEPVRKDEIPWSECYLGLGAVFFALTVAVWVGAYPFTLISPLLILGVLSLTLLSVATIHTVGNQKRRL